MAGEHPIRVLVTDDHAVVRTGIRRALDAVDGNWHVFVADRFNNRIQEFTNAGSFLTKWGTVGKGDGQFANPIGVAVDENLNVFVTDFFTASGVAARTWPATSWSDRFPAHRLRLRDALVDVGPRDARLPRGGRTGR
jgi:DNA-binding beta-propeller fold protein YncE